MKCETIADIVAAMRGRGEDGRMDMMLWREYADRIEAAAKREREAVTAEQSSVVGNAAALREALVCLRDAARDFYNQILNSKYSVILDKYTCCKQGFPAVLALRHAFPNANFAISKPPRNCDVGTPEEQAERFWGYCNAHSCNECPARGGWRTVYVDGASCKLIQCGVLWAQMPYEAQEGGAK